MQPDDERDWKRRIEEILDAIDRIKSYTEGLDFEAFAANSLVTDAVSYRFIVIGEAANQVPAVIQSRAPMIPWRNMRDMRNVVAHNYRGLNLRVVWLTLTENFGPLTVQLQTFLNSDDTPSAAP